MWIPVSPLIYRPNESCEAWGPTPHPPYLKKRMSGSITHKAFLNLRSIQFLNNLTYCRLLQVARSFAIAMLNSLSSPHYLNFDWVLAVGVSFMIWDLSGGAAEGASIWVSTVAFAVCIPSFRIRHILLPCNSFSHEWSRAMYELLLKWQYSLDDNIIKLHLVRLQKFGS